MRPGMAGCAAGVAGFLLGRASPRFTTRRQPETVPIALPPAGRAGRVAASWDPGRLGNGRARGDRGARPAHAAEAGRDRSPGRHLLCRHDRRVPDQLPDSDPGGPGEVREQHPGLYHSRESRLLQRRERLLRDVAAAEPGCSECGDSGKQLLLPSERHVAARVHGHWIQ